MISGKWLLTYDRTISGAIERRKGQGLPVRTRKLYYEEGLDITSMLRLLSQPDLAFWNFALAL
jgi:hypothetical protein